MCELLGAAALKLFGGAGGATAAGATAGAAAGGLFAGNALQTIGTVLMVGGQVYGGFAQARAIDQQRQDVARQQQEQAQLSAIEEQRTMRAWRSEIRKQAAEMGARGIAMDSPTAVALGETAAREMAFAAQSARSTGIARAAELSATQRSLAARRRLSILDGTLGAAGSFLSAAPRLWPNLSERRVG